MNNDYLKRCDLLQNKVKESGFDAAIITSNANLFYLLGYIIDGYVFVPSDGDIKIFVKKPVDILADNVVYIRKPEDIPAHVSLAVNSIMLENDGISAGEYLRLSKLFDNAKTASCSTLLREIRSIKTPLEIEIIRETAKKHCLLYSGISGLYKNGMTDFEFSAEVEHRARSLGHLGLFRTFGFRMEAYLGSVLSGENAAHPSPFDFALGGKGVHPSNPLGVTNTEIKENTTVMVDISFNLKGYLTDISRTYVKGNVPDFVCDAHNLSIKIQDEIARRGVPGTSCEELYDLSVKMAEEAGFAKNFMGLGQQARFVGHGTGIEINELPVLAVRSKSLLEKNMVVALEPKFVFEGIGAAGTENTYLVTENGLEKLTDCDEGIIRLD